MVSAVRYIGVDKEPLYVVRDRLELQAFERDRLTHGGTWTNPVRAGNRGKAPASSHVDRPCRGLADVSTCGYFHAIRQTSSLG